MKTLNIVIVSCIFFLIVFSINILAVEQPTQQFNKIFLSPFYIASTTSGVDTNFTINVNPPDKISSVVSAMINFDIWLNPSVNFTLKVNGQKCNNPEYYISTTYAGAGKNTISFDCSNVIRRAGTYSIQLKANKDTGTLTGYLDLTYMNNPLGDLKLHGTEYTLGQTAKVWLQLINNSGDYVDNGLCFIDIFTPDDTIFLDEILMTNTGNRGTYEIGRASCRERV